MLLVARGVAGDEPEDLRGDLMDSAQGATPHQPAASPATGRATVYIETSGSVRSRVGTCQRLGPPTLVELTARIGDISVGTCQSLDQQRPVNN
jgi:hypothetical protein